jgi:hypothetical protein
MRHSFDATQQPADRIEVVGCSETIAACANDQAPLALCNEQ